MRGENAAYVIYTSGSTGKPKGVVVQHRSLVNSILALASCSVAPSGNSLLLMSYAFDGSLLSIFSALTQGGTLTIPREGQQADPTQVARLIAEKRIQYFFSVPSYYSLLLEQAQPEQIESLRVVYVGGETCPPELVGRHQELLPDTRLINVYGPTEATLWCTSHECLAQDALKPVPVGKPSNNMQAYILDHHLQPLPTGVPGHIYIGGLSLSRGYLHQPALTAQKFIPHPFSTLAGARLYQTGDRGRFHPNAEIEYLGRFDNQVKVRGYRIELGEIEAVLLEQDGVREAAVVVREEEGREKRLIGYVVIAEGESASVGEIREGIRRRLPEYMIPSMIVEMERMPETASGKINRLALPVPDGMQLGQDEAYQAPRTMMEEMLAKLWGDVLGLERVSINRNFFELGGDSLLATKLAFQVRKVFEIELPLTVLFQHPTVADLASLVEEDLARQMDNITEEEAEQLLLENQEQHEV